LPPGRGSCRLAVIAVAAPITDNLRVAFARDCSGTPVAQRYDRWSRQSLGIRRYLRVGPFVMRLRFRAVLNWSFWPLAAGGPAAGRRSQGMARAGGGGRFPHPLGDCLAWMSGTARIRCWPVPGDGWTGSTRATRGITTSISTAGSCGTCQPRRRAAVDVGCGTGVLAGKLAPHFARVTGIDADAGMAGAASARLAHDPGVTIRHRRFEQFAVAAGHSEADLITMVAVLHHLDLEDTLARIPGLLAPGGRLLVVGLARVSSLPDLAAGLISAAVNPVMG
jgi:hypothetical protein